MDWNKIWAFNKKVIDPVAPRYTALSKSDLVPITFSDNLMPTSKKVQKHPKDAAVGEKELWYGPRVLIEQEDAKTIKEGDTVTLINWGNVKIDKIDTDSNGQVKSVAATLNLDNTVCSLASFEK